MNDIMRSAAALALFTASMSTARAQRATNTAPPDFDTSQALGLMAIQLPCLDRLQPKVPPRVAPRDTARTDSTRTDTTRAAAPDARGANYFWVTTYSLVPAHNQTRAFWGCTDWHSAVSATWATAYLARSFPQLALQDLAREKLADHLGASNLNGELAFFDAAARSINPIPFSGQRPLFERPYGFAWLLKLQSELHTWPDSAARKWSANTAPLARWMADSLGAYLSALPEPVRTGSQSNTAFSMLLAHDYATTVGDAALLDQLRGNARRFYMNDRACKVELEGGAPAAVRTAGRGRAGGVAVRPAVDSVNDLSSPAAIAAARANPNAAGDVLSPCATEAALMARILSTAAFVEWLDGFLPPLDSAHFAPLAEPAGGPSLDAAMPAAGRTRFSMLSFARAQALERIAHALPLGDPRIATLRRLSSIHATRGFELLAGNVDAATSVPAFALLYIDARRGPLGVACSTCAAAANEQVYVAADTTPPKEREYADLASFARSLPRVKADTLDAPRAVLLSAMPLACQDHAQPRPAATPYLWEQAFSPIDSFETRRAFYGCYDWHSAVNSAWTLVKLLKMYPTMATAAAIREQLNRHFGVSNITGEIEFFNSAGAFELPYGYAWFLRLQGELESWNDVDGKRWASNLRPLAALFAARMVTYFDGLRQPVRTGVHPNTAMAMDNALFYATHFDPKLDSAIRRNAVRLFAKDIRCNTAGEPGASDFQSPCLYEAVIMGQLMPRTEYLTWLDRFLPPVHSAAFRSETKTLGLEFAESAHASVSSTSHLVGLSLVRAMLLARLAALLPSGDARVPVLRQAAVVQAQMGLPQIGAVGYDGSHYYATWVTTYFLAMPNLIRGATP